jgi:L-iditol 2-dehydrogenase
MLVVRLHPDGLLRDHDEPAPEPAEGEALVRVTAVGLCGSDRHWLLERSIGGAPLDRPLVLGHEFGGVAETGRYRGRRVAVDPAAPCWNCSLCESGRENLCLDLRFAGHSPTDGALRELVAWPERSIQPVADELGRDEEALVEPLAIAIHALDLGGLVELGAGASVAVLGAGPIGLLIVALAREAGARTIVATDPLPHRLDAARELGATAALDPAETGAVRAALGDRGADVVFEAAGVQPAIDDAVELAAPGSTVVIVGIPSEDRTSFSASVARRKGLVLKLTRRSTASAFARAVDLANRRQIDLGSLISLRVPLTAAREGFDALVERGGIKVVVEPTQLVEWARSEGVSAREDRAA